MKEQIFLSVLLYAHNHGPAVPAAIRTIDAFISDKFQNTEIILIDDGSTDNTAGAAEAIAGDINSNLTVISLARRHNIETAMQAGLDFSIGDFVVEIDNPEMDFPVDMIHTLYARATEGFDLVSAVPSGAQRMTSSLYYKLFRRLANVDITLETETCRILTRRAINAISTIKDKSRYRKIIYKLSGYDNTTVHYTPARPVRSTLTLPEKINMASDMLFSFSNVGLNITAYLSLMFLSFSVFLGLYALYMYATYKQIVEGWTTLMIFLSFGFSGLFLVLSILSKYLSMILNEIRTIPAYTVKSIKKL